MIGKNISHYKILEKLGEGGMGVVYKAEDTKLDRFVALKFLPPHIVASEEEKTRFVHEAKAAAALDHPNVCTVYEIGEHEENTFISMAYIDGQTLKDKIAERPLKIDDALDIAIQIGEGLQEAHEKKIVHRDIKSANIMFTSKGQVKITDFGLAKLSGRTKVTKTGTTVGTAAYMSPEQAQGNEVDRRTDIWSLGVILYEMISGQLPFKGDYEQAMMYAILNEEPEPLTGVRTGVPMELERIISKALSKNFDERYQHVDEMLVDLKTINKEIQFDKSKQPSQKKEIKYKKKLPIFGSIITFLFILIICGYFFWPNEKTPIIIVFPFSNLSEETNDYNIGLPFAAEIISNLAYTKTLAVRSFNTVREYEVEEVNVKTARNEKADFMVTGNYYLNEDKELHLIIELTDVHKDNSIWVETYDIPYADWQKCQDLISENVISNLDLQVSQTELNNMHADVSNNPDAYEFYLRSISYPLSIEGCLQAIAMLENSIKLDSIYAPAYLELGYRVKYYGEIVLGGAEKYKEAELLYKKALSLNSESTIGLGRLAGLYTELGKTEEAIKLARRALTINPNDANIHYYLSYIYRYTGMLNESEQEGEKALELDPNNQKFQSIVKTYIYQGNLEKALKIMDNFKDNPFIFMEKGKIYIRLGQFEKARNYFNRIIEKEPEGAYASGVKCFTAVLDDNKKEGLEIIRRIEKETLVDGEIFYEIASLYCLLDDYKNAVRMLSKTVEHGYFNYPFMQKDIFLDPMRNDPDFQQVLALAKEKHVAFKKKYFTK